MNKKMTSIIALIMAVSLTGCSSLSTTHTDKHGDTYVKGVVYYDRDGVLQPAVPEALSPQAQDNLQTVGWVAVATAAVTGAVTGIVALTK